MLTLKNIRKIFGERRVLERVSFSLGEGQKAALVGQNGVGKSTLLKVIAGEESYDRGEILKPNRALVGYLPQETGALPQETLAIYLRRMAGLLEREQEMKRLEKHLEEPEALATYETLQAEYERLGGYDFDRKAKSVLEGLFLSHLDQKRLVSELSGGEKRKAALAGVLLRGVDILLLDEPTNNLDLPALLWLEKYLKRSKATCLIASHDRRFLDQVVGKVIELEWFKRETIMYTGGWSDYAEMKAHAHRRHKEQYRMQEEERVRIKESIAEKKEWVIRVKEKVAPDNDKFTSNYKKERAARKFDASAKALEGREKRLDDIERPLERPFLEVPLSVPGKQGGDIVLKKVVFGHKKKDQISFENGPLDLKLPFGSRIALLGNNGVGKSTLLQTITGNLEPISGTVTRGEGVVFGYLMQEHETLSSTETLKEFFKKRLEHFDADVVNERLGTFQFPPGILNDKIASFSPGERVRIILALLSLLNATVLILDEPTNHLDLEAIEALEEALVGYPGTVLLVTHDRLFLERMNLSASYLLEAGKLTLVQNYAEYEDKVLNQVKRVLKRLEEKHGK